MIKRQASSNILAEEKASIATLREMPKMSYTSRASQAFEVFLRAYTEPAFEPTDWTPHSPSDMTSSLRALQEFLEHFLPQRINQSFREGCGDTAAELLEPTIEISDPIVDFVEDLSDRYLDEDRGGFFDKADIHEWIQYDFAAIELILWEWSYHLEPASWTVTNGASREAWKRSAGEAFALRRDEAEFLGDYAAAMETFARHSDYADKAITLSEHAGRLHLFQELSPSSGYLSQTVPLQVAGHSDMLLWDIGRRCPPDRRDSLTRIW